MKVGRSRPEATPPSGEGDRDSGAALGSPRKCPICGRPSRRETYPFCSKRCADVDLNRWLSGAYAIPAEPVTEEDDGEGP
jgi:endogenous inhibitor of DNA gyrase (YacG/DUF329 family)